MRRASTVVLIGAMLLVVFALFGGASRTNTIRAHAVQAATPTSLAPEIPADAKVLELDKPIVETIDPNTAIRFYTFNAKGGQLYRLTMNPKSGTFYSTITVMSLDLQTIIGGTLGEDLISGSLVIRVPSDGTYAVSIEYADINENSPASGSYEISISAVKPQ